MPILRSKPYATRAGLLRAEVGLLAPDLIALHLDGIALGGGPSTGDMERDGPAAVAGPAVTGRAARHCPFAQCSANMRTSQAPRLTS
jgi:hypothetical protein